MFGGCNVWMFRFFVMYVMSLILIMLVEFVLLEEENVKDIIGLLRLKDDVVEMLSLVLVL